MADSGRRLKEANDELAVLYARLRELDRVKTQFFANVSHELRTPLALILGPAERILADLGPDDPRRRQLDVILRNARVLLGHVNDLLDASKIEASMLELDYTDLNLSHLVRLVANNFETLALDRSVDFRVLAPDDAVTVQVDPARVQQVLLNLLSNDVEIHPTSRDRPDRAQGRDRGRYCPGRGGRQRPRRSDGARARRGLRAVPPARRGRHTQDGGTGLGLHIPPELVSLHGGALVIDDAPEGGALFVVELPVVAPTGTTVRTEGVTVPETRRDAARRLWGADTPCAEPRPRHGQRQTRRRRRPRQDSALSSWPRTTLT